MGQKQNYLTTTIFSVLLMEILMIFIFFMFLFLCTIFVKMLNGKFKSCYIQCNAVYELCKCCNDLSKHFSSTQVPTLIQHSSYTVFCVLFYTENQLKLCHTTKANARASHRLRIKMCLFSAATNSI